MNPILQNLVEHSFPAWINRADNFVEYRFNPVEGKRRIGIARLFARQKHVLVHFYQPQQRKRGPGIPKTLKGETASVTYYAPHFEVAADSSLNELGDFFHTTATFWGDGVALPASGPAGCGKRKAPATDGKQTLEQAEQRAEEELAEPIDTEDDGRVSELRAVSLRRERGKFRKALLKAYEKQCAVTGCTMEAKLEAAHLIQGRPHEPV